MLQDLQNFDSTVFRFINGRLVNSVFDVFFVYVTDIKNTWWIVCILACTWVLVRKKRALFALASLCALIFISDQFNSKVIKNWVQRPRPSMTLGEDHVRLLTHHHSGYSFMSTHACNAFTVAAFVSLVEPAVAAYIFALALAIGYSRIYVGVHYPLDVICAALFGIVLASVFWALIWARFERVDTPSK